MLVKLTSALVVVFNVGDALGTPPGLCHSDEHVAFSCRIGKKLVSLCASPSNAKTPFLQYRFGTVDKVELRFPEKTNGSLKKFRRSHRWYSGGWGESISFYNGDSRYEIYHNNIKRDCNEEKEGPCGTSPEAGVFAEKKGSVIFSEDCDKPQDFFFPNGMWESLVEEEPETGL